MKIYTFNAADDTRVEILWSLRPKKRDKIFQNFITETEYIEVDSIQDCQVAIHPIRVFTPETLAFDSSVFDSVKEAKKYGKPLVIDATSDSDTFLDIPTANILRCGLYKSLQKPFETECPFWSNYRTYEGLNCLTILPKGKKPIVGFCGTTSSTGKLATITKFSSPTAITKWVLSQGSIAQKTDRRIVEGMSLQVRAMALRLLAANKGIDSHFDVTDDHTTYYAEDIANKVFLEDLFIKNTRKCDYVLCIRGSGNYSGRFYMALSAGRIPVVVDTDIVIPFESELNIVKIPTNSIESIGDFILEHFNNTTDQEFQEMKLKNQDAYNRFLAPEKFLTSFLNEVANIQPKIEGIKIQSVKVA